MKKRGVIYLYWGHSVTDELNRSIQSVKRHHPELPVEQVKLPDDADLLSKSSLLEHSPFETNLFLDTDTVVMDKLDFGFEKAEKWGLACCINECPWARRYGGIEGNQIEYNTGVLFYTQKAKPVFEKWAEIARTIDSSIVFRRDGQNLVMRHNDQAGFSQAMETAEFNPYVLPLNWNFRPQWQESFFGPIKIWHDRSQIPDGLKIWNEHQSLEQSIVRYSRDAK